jgi:diguanylate cyclase (GGDEF)-like protein
VVGAGRRHTSTRLRFVVRRVAAAHKPDTPGRSARDRKRFNTRLAQQNELLRQREEELNRQIARFDAALSNMSQGLCMFDADYRLVVCNARYLQMYRLTAAQTQPGTTFRQLLDYRLEQGTFPLGASRDQYAAELRISLQRTSAWSKVTQLPDGRFILVSNRIMPDGGWIATHDDVTEREGLHARSKEQEEQLRTRNLQFDMAVNNMSQGLCFFDGEQRLLVCNDRYLEMYGLDPEQIYAGITLREIIDLRYEIGSFPAMSKEEYHAWRNSVAVSDQRSDTIVELKNGRIFEIHHRPMSGGGWVATHDDITERQRLKGELERNNKLLSERTSLLQAIVDNFPGGIGFFDKDLRVVVCNDKAMEILDLPRSMFANGPPLLEDLLRFNAMRGEYGPGDIEEQVASKLALAADRTTYHFERQRPNGTVLDVRGGPIDSGGFITTYMDITERTRSQAKIAHMARHDALTNLANRILLNERLEHVLRQAKRGGVMALHLIDLDRFKAVNDTLGHPAGDKLLQMVADRLRALVRETDTIARMGGDEFAIAQASAADPAEAAALAQRIVGSLSEPYDIDGHRAVIGVSVGIAMGPGDGLSPDQIIRNADLALYGAKNDGRGTFCFFEPEMDAQMQARHTIERDMRKALGAGEFELYYQPMVNLESGEITAFEALIRWHHPTQGMVMPDKFIPLADETGFIVSIGEWTIREACATAAKWPGRLRVAVNLSPVQFRSATLPLAVAGALAASGLAPDRLELEINEMALWGNVEAALSILYQLRGLGVRIAMDDFGTGYSSLKYLQSFPFDKIKIDRSFVTDITEGAGSRNIVRAVSALARGFGMETTVEGVENPEQLAAVRAEGCHEMQGYLFSRPLPADEIERLFLRDLGPARAGSTAAA